MTQRAMPVGIRRAKGVQVLVSEAAAATALVAVQPGWHVLPRAQALRVAELCEQHGRPNRRNPMPPGQRIALQGLARQIRHRLESKA